MSKKVDKGVVVLDLLITNEDNPDASLQVNRIEDIFKKGLFIHLVATKIKEDCGCIKKVEIIVFSFRPFRPKTYGPINIGESNLEVSYDLSDVIHTNMYCRHILGMGPVEYSKKEDVIWHNRKMTKYCKSLGYFGYKEIMSYLLEKHQARTVLRSLRPRKRRDEKFEDDFLDKAISLFLTRIIAIMNNCLYWGADEMEAFNLENKIEMRSVLK